MELVRINIGFVDEVASRTTVARKLFSLRWRKSGASWDSDGRSKRAEIIECRDALAAAEVLDLGHLEPARSQKIVGELPVCSLMQLLRPTIA
jgi:hypothetical protein